MALGGSVSVPVIGSVGFSLAKPSDKRAAAVMGGVIQSALTGNLTAVKCLDERRTSPSFTAPFGISSERAVWNSGYQQVVTTKPELVAQYSANRSKIPAIDHTNPETAAASALARPFSASGVQTPAAVQSAAILNNSPALSAAANATVAKTGMPLWMLALLAGGAAWLVYKTVKKG